MSDNQENGNNDQWGDNNADQNQDNQWGNQQFSNDAWNNNNDWGQQNSWNQSAWTTPAEQAQQTHQSDQQQSDQTSSSHQTEQMQIPISIPSTSNFNTQIPQANNFQAQIPQKPSFSFSQPFGVDLPKVSNFEQTEQHKDPKSEESNKNILDNQKTQDLINQKEQNQSESKPEISKIDSVKAQTSMTVTDSPQTVKAPELSKLAQQNSSSQINIPTKIQSDTNIQKPSSKGESDVKDFQIQKSPNTEQKQAKDFWDDPFSQSTTLTQSIVSNQQRPLQESRDDSHQQESVNLEDLMTFDKSIKKTTIMPNKEQKDNGSVLKQHLSEQLPEKNVQSTQSVIQTSKNIKNEQNFTKNKQELAQTLPSQEANSLSKQSSKTIFFGRHKHEKSTISESSSTFSKKSKLEAKTLPPTQQQQQQQSSSSKVQMVKLADLIDEIAQLKADKQQLQGEIAAFCFSPLQQFKSEEMADLQQRFMQFCQQQQNSIKDVQIDTLSRRVAELERQSTNSGNQYYAQQCNELQQKLIQKEDDAMRVQEQCNQTIREKNQQILQLQKMLNNGQ